jgi:hypothetical protein
MGPEVIGGRTADGRPLIVVSRRDHIPENLRWPASFQIARAAFRVTQRAEWAP